MRFAYVGNRKHPWCTEVHLTRTLEQMGHYVNFLQEDQQTARNILDTARGDHIDVLVYQRTWGIQPDQDGLTLQDVWDRLKHDGIVTTSYHLDLYLGLERGNDETLKADPFWGTQYVFTPDGDPQCEAEFFRLGINHRYVRPGVVKDECVPGVFTRKYAHPVVFVGSQSYHPEWPHRQELLHFLGIAYKGRYQRYGGGAEVVRGEALNNLYASAQVVVGDSLCPVHPDGSRHVRYTSDRAYETIGRGGFLIHPYVEGMDEELVDGEHLRYYQFGDFAGLAKLVDYYLDHEDERNKIRTQGQAFVRDNCSYTERLRQAFGQIGMEL